MSRRLSLLVVVALVASGATAGSAAADALRPRVQRRSTACSSAPRRRSTSAIPPSTACRSTSTSRCRPTRRRAVPDDRDARTASAATRPTAEGTAPRRRQQRLLGPARLRGRQPQRPRLRPLLRQRRLAHRRLRARLDPPRRPALRGARRPGAARPARRPGHRRSRGARRRPAAPTAAASASSWRSCATASACPTAASRRGAAPPAGRCASPRRTRSSRGRTSPTRSCPTAASATAAATAREARTPFGVPLLELRRRPVRAAATSPASSRPRGADPDADLTGWSARSTRASRYDAEAQAIVDEFFAHHQAWRPAGPPGAAADPQRLDGRPLPRPARPAHLQRRALARPGRARRAAVRRPRPLARDEPRRPSAPPSTPQAAAFFDHWLKGAGSPHRRRAASRPTRRPARQPGRAPRAFAARSWRQLHPGRLRFGGGPAQTFTSDGGNPATAAAFDPIGGTSDACQTVPAEIAPGTATYTRAVTEPLHAARPAHGPRAHPHDRRYGQIVSRLWDVLPDGTQRLVTRGIYRLRPTSAGT